MRSEQQDRLTVDDCSTGVVDGDDLQGSVAPHPVHVRGGEDRIGGVPQDGLLERHRAAGNLPRSTVPFHRCARTCPTGLVAGSVKSAYLPPVRVMPRLVPEPYGQSRGRVRPRLDWGRSSDGLGPAHD